MLGVGEEIGVVGDCLPGQPFWRMLLAPVHRQGQTGRLACLKPLNPTCKMGTVFPTLLVLGDVRDGSVCMCDEVGEKEGGGGVQ